MWNKGGFVCHIVKGRKIKQREKVGIHDASGIPSFHDVFRPLLAGIINFSTFSCQLQISETWTNVFRLLLFRVSGPGGRSCTCFLSKNLLNSLGLIQPSCSSRSALQANHRCHLCQLGTPLTLSVRDPCRHRVRLTTLLPIFAHSAVICGPFDSKLSANGRELNFRSSRPIWVSWGNWGKARGSNLVPLDRKSQILTESNSCRKWIYL
jgi:hypothetical protein